MGYKELAQCQFGQLLKVMLSKLLIIILSASLWVLLYVSGCSLLSNLPGGSVAVVLYILVLWFIAPLVFIVVCWQRLIKHQGSRAEPRHYGLFFCTSLFLWLLLSIIMGLGPCYRYDIAGINYFGEAIFTITTLPLIFFEAGYRATSLSSPLLLLFALAIVFPIGLLFGHLKRFIVEKQK